MAGLEINLIVPDLWQQEAVRALRAGRDVVVHAPTGAGKTYIFELLYPLSKGQAVFTVPTRALANDKLAEWRTKGWDVGIATGDLALNLDAKVIVATLETQKGKFLRRQGPRLLAIDEYQMIGDPVRGVNYELALALAPKETQLLLLSGSVGNPQDVVEWLQRIGRDVLLVSHGERPVPLDDVDLPGLPGGERVRSFWPRMVAKAFNAELDPVLVFAPRRNASEDLAHQIASTIPCIDPLTLSPEQELLAGPRLAKLLKNRVAYHHSGLSYALRAGLIEPLAKAGHLRAVVATMGLASGINFSMRSVLVTDTRYMVGNFERSVQPDELLQMFGRAGRRGLDEAGFVLAVPGQPRLSDSRPRQLKRALQVDWPSLISVMRNAALLNEQKLASSNINGDDETRQQSPLEPPFAAAVELSRSLFSVQRVPLCVEHSLETGPMPCGLWIDAERARLVRKGVVEMLNSRGVWEPRPVSEQETTLGELWVREGERWTRALKLPRTLEGIGTGNLCRLGKGIYGRELPVAIVDENGGVTPVKWVRHHLREEKASALAREGAGIRSSQDRSGRRRRGQGRGDKQKDAQHSTANAPLRQKEPPPTREEIEQGVMRWVAPGQVQEFVLRGKVLTARVDFSQISASGYLDSFGHVLLDPPIQEDLPRCCRHCPELEWCRAASPAVSSGFAWRRLGLVENDGAPTTRGILFGFFNNGEGLAVAAALQDEGYPLEDLLYDLANLRAGPRFAGDDPVLGGRLGSLCQRVYERADHPGYLEMGVPIGYGAGAAEIVREMIEHPGTRHRLVNESLRQGDIERAVTEWVSLVRHIANAPDFELPRWMELKTMARKIVESIVPPNRLDFPPLLASQTRRYERPVRRAYRA